MRIIALVPGGIGDQILFFPTLDDLKQSYSDAQIDVVVEPRARDAYRVSKSVNETIPFDFKGRNSLADFGNLLGIIRDREYDIALTLGQRWSVRFLLWLTGIPTRIGYAGGSGQSLLTNPVPLNQNQYAAAMYHDLLKGLDINTPCPPLAVSVPAKDLDWAESERKRLGNQDYVLIHGGSSQLAKDKGINKIYPVESWSGIIQDFNRRQPDLPIVVVQGPEDAEFVQALVEANPKLKVTMPKDVGKLTAMIAGANLMLCTDSAPMHLAVAVQTYTLALFGPTDPQKLLPQDDRFVGIKSLTGQMADISPQTVLEKVWAG
ncbi:glycosyltransferase family 9 protein [Leptolyngbya sp. FACHB-36]|uniref:glycosyltransferase family 9 protein n=1 Tax=Leptolyngbya sp. FACHB-36 TaxID=2692808 RepID=UPI0016810E3C|nr:glycosyltransferase family 9 protein [Leptolyngbya sp. FACHB-36]MBD2022544.1 glycosyltransferase family 9 protein [Leptolyngbya sp. FACHB-36]